MYQIKLSTEKTCILYYLNIYIFTIFLYCWLKVIRLWLDHVDCTSLALQVAPVSYYCSHQIHLFVPISYFRGWRHHAKCTFGHITEKGGGYHDTPSPAGLYFAGTTGSTCLILLFKFFYWTSSQVRSHLLSY
jgi:hypothetical protein